MSLHSGAVVPPLVRVPELRIRVGFLFQLQIRGPFPPTRHEVEISRVKMLMALQWVGAVTECKVRGGRVARVASTRYHARFELRVPRRRLGRATTVSGAHTPQQLKRGVPERPPLIGSRDKTRSL